MYLHALSTSGLTSITSLKLLFVKLLFIAIDIEATLTSSIKTYDFILGSL